MQASTLIRGVLLMVLLVSLAQSSANAKEPKPAAEPAAYFAQAIARVAGAVRLTSEAGFGYNEGLSLFGGFIRKGGSTSLNSELLAGEDYALIGGGDDDATDVDLEIFDPNGQRVAFDEKDNAMPVVRFKARARGYYRIKLSLANGRDPASFCAMAIMRLGGWNVPPTNMVSACVKALGAQALLAERGIKFKFHDQPNQWSFFGGVIPKKNKLRLDKISLGNGRRVVITCADDAAKDIDTVLANNRGKIVAADEDDKPMCIVEHNADSDESYTVQMENVRSDGPTLTVSIILSR